MNRPSKVILIELRPHCLYTRNDLANLLSGSGLEVDTFIARLRPRKVFKLLFFGEDLIAALRTAPALSDRSDAPALSSTKNRQKQRKKHGNEEPGSKLIKEYGLRR